MDYEIMTSDLAWIFRMLHFNFGIYIPLVTLIFRNINFTILYRHIYLFYYIRANSNFGSLTQKKP